MPMVHLASYVCVEPKLLAITPMVGHGIKLEMENMSKCK